MILIQKIIKIKKIGWLKEVIKDVFFYSISLSILSFFIYTKIPKHEFVPLFLTEDEPKQTEKIENEVVEYNFVASSRGKYYYRIKTDKANELSDKYKVYFKTEEDAKNQGFKPYFED